jgi:glucose-1-phosphate thymidylyltransferase
VHSQIRGPAIIGAQTIVQHSYIGPYTALGSNCIVRNGEVEYSIICPGTQILDATVRIERSLLGREVIIRRGHIRPTTQKFIIGDQSIIELV